jgi:hypothetical protein
MAIGFGATAGTVSTTTSTATPMTFTANDPLGSDVWLIHNINGGSAPTAVTYNGSAPDAGTDTAVATIGHGSVGSLRIYYWHAKGTGSNVTVAATPGGNSNRCQIRTLSYTGVGSVGSPATTFGQSTAIAAGAATLTAGQVALGLLSSAAGVAVGPMSSPTGSGATNRSLVNDAANAGGICLSDSPTSGVVFGCTSSSGSTPWSNVVIILTPSAAADTTKFFSLLSR